MLLASDAPVAAARLLAQHGSADVAIETICETLRATARTELAERPVFSSGAGVADYLWLTLAHRPVEAFHVLFLDTRNRLITDEAMTQGSVSAAAIYPREIIARALQLGATALILAHNHPAGDDTPSTADIDLTRKLATLASGMGIAVHDHLIVSRTGVTSLRAKGLL